jgi:hypothetical protein
MISAFTKNSVYTSIFGIFYRLLRFSTDPVNFTKYSMKINSNEIRHKGASLS